MANGKDDTAATTPAVAPSSEAGRHESPTDERTTEVGARGRTPDTTLASPAAADAALRASADWPTADQVAMVSRDVNGDPAQSANYTVLVPEDATDADREAHHNRPGELLGAANVKATAGSEVDPARLGVAGLTDEQRQERDIEETRQLARINSGKHLADL